MAAEATMLVGEGSHADDHGTARKARLVPPLSQTPAPPDLTITLQFVAE